MNERIRELAEQARRYAFEQIGNSQDPTEWSKCHDMFEKKLAELVVQECLAQIDTVRDGCEEDGEHQQALGADWAGLAVARHFGVE